MSGLTWLHLSDWHQKGKDFDRQVVRDALIDDIKNRSKIHSDLEKIDFIVFSGDLTFSGKREEFEAARENFLEPVRLAAGVEKDRIFIVPGNHDINRDLFKYLPPDLTKPLTTHEAITEWLTDEKGRNKLLEPFKEYRQFIHQYAGDHLTPYTSLKEILIDGKTIAIMGFNSALMCSRNIRNNNEVDDYGKIILGEPQIHDILRAHEKADIRIAVLHHPLEWLTESDRDRVEGILRKGVDFILYGHSPKGRAETISGTEGHCILIPSGSAYDRRNFYNSFNYVHLDTQTGMGFIYFRRWSGEESLWISNNSQNLKGIFDFQIPIKKNEYFVPDDVVITNDSPAMYDQLNYRVYAKPIAKILRQIWQNSEQSYITNKKKYSKNSIEIPTKYEAFMLHIYGPWGSGKSSMLNFLENELKSASDEEKLVIIKFNAWQNQHIDPPWWPLFMTIFKQAKIQLWNYFKFKGKILSCWIWIKMFIFRLIMGREYIPLAFLILIFLTLLIFPSIKGVVPYIIKVDDAEKISKLISAILAIIGFITTLFVFIKKISVSFVNTSSSAAHSFIQFTSDSMNSISKYFEHIVKTIRKPVAIFIDDLDRCKPKYVVQFLEGIQTLFKKNQILYVVAADRNWINICFKECYKEFSGSIKKTGQNLGDLFVEKIFQLSIRIPKLSSNEKSKYLDYLLFRNKIVTEPHDQLIGDHQKKIYEIFKEEVTDDEILKKYENALNDGIPKEIAREIVLEKLSDQKVHNSLEHALQPFAKFLGSNPRSIKRLVNFYAIYRIIAFIEERNIERSKLVRWLILTMRWPMLAEYLIENPDHVKWINSNSSQNLKDLKLSKEILFLFKNNEVIDLIDGDKKEIDRFDSKSIIQLADFL